MSRAHLTLFAWQAPGARIEPLTQLGRDVAQVVSLGPDRWATINESPDGNTLTFFDLASKTTHGPYPQLRVNHIERGPDGSIFFTDSHREGLYSLRADTGEETLVVPGLSPGNWNAWTAGHSALYYAGDGGVYRMDLATRTSELVTDLTSNAIGLTMAVNADETMLLLVRTDGIEIDINARPKLFRYARALG